MSMQNIHSLARMRLHKNFKCYIYHNIPIVSERRGFGGQNLRHVLTRQRFLKAGDPFC